MNIYVDRLSNIYNENKNSRSSIQNIKEKFHIFENEINDYLNFIPSFFSENGDAKSIHELYVNLRDNKISSKKIDFIDINQSSYVYNEYMEGMKHFISDIFECNYMTENSNEIKDNLDKASHNDSLFIESIFGGNNNEKISDNLKNASKNIEFLIDFIPTLESFKKDAMEMIERTNTLSRENDTILNDSIDMYMESVSHYSYQIIKNIITTYDEIQNSINNKPEKQVVFKLY